MNIDLASWPLGRTFCFSDLPSVSLLRDAKAALPGIQCKMLHFRMR